MNEIFSNHKTRGKCIRILNFKNILIIFLGYFMFLVMPIAQLFVDFFHFQQDIIDALDKVCSILPDTISEECKTFVDTYTPAILTLLKDEVSAEEVCQQLGLCSQKNDQATQNMLLLTSKCFILCELSIFIFTMAILISSDSIFLE